MLKLRVTRTVEVPNPKRLARFAAAPELGPGILFFSGGTALRDLSRELINYTHNSVHLITPFDSGGSSAELRKAFRMLAVGDVRNRLMALADRSLTGTPEVYDLFTYRLEKGADQEELAKELDRLVKGTHRLMARVPDPMRKLIRSHLGFFTERMPKDFDLRGASIGNLILAGGYFNHGRHIDPVIYLFSKLVEVRGMVRPTISRDLHLCAELADGRMVIGQHLITGKETAPLDAPVKRLFLSKAEDVAEPVRPGIRKKVQKLITEANLICYPMGSFYTSVVANLLPAGVGRAIAQAECPKVYVANSLPDPEQIGMGLADSVRALFRYLQEDFDELQPRDRLLNFLLIDSKHGRYPDPLELHKVTRMGVEVVDVPLCTDESAPAIDPTLLLEHLLSLV
jgi:CofD-related protein of GAK system